MPSEMFRMWEIDLVPEKRPSKGQKGEDLVDFDDVSGDFYDDFVIIERQKQQQVQLNHKIKEEEKIKDEGGKSQLLIARVGMSHEEQGYSLEDFKIRKVIDKGSFGKVFLVVNQVNGKLYAMKRINKDILIDKKQI
jgi:hypothetical protein